MNKLLFGVIMVCIAGSFFGTAPMVQAQLDVTLPDMGFGTKDSSSKAVERASGGQVLPSATVFQNPGRRFQFVLPAGWSHVSGSMEDEGGALFKKAGSPVFFQFHMTPMVKSFPAEASVQASLSQSQEQVQINRLLTAKRRDAGNRASGSPFVIGWEVVESDQGSGGLQRIIWQCYDQENYYFHFMASTEPAFFPAHRAEMQQIIDSIEFK